jgi:oligopeptide transport system permease protein
MNSATPPAATASIEPAPIRVDQLEQGTSLWKDAWYRLRKNHVALFGLYAFCVIAILCLVGPYFTGYTYEQTEISLKASAPMEPVFLRSEALKTGGPKKGFVALSNLEDEFLEKADSDRKAIVEKIAKGGTYTEGKVTYGPSNRRHLFGTDPLGRDLLTWVGRWTP